MASHSPIPPADDGFWKWARTPAFDAAIVTLNKLCALEVISGGNRFPVRFAGENAVIELSLGLSGNGLSPIAPYSILGNTSAAISIPVATTSPILTSIQFGPSGGIVAGSSGSITFTAGGTNQNLIFSPSGTGTFQCTKPAYFGDGINPTFGNNRDFNVMSTTAGISMIRFGSSRSPFIELISRASVSGSDIAYWDWYVNSTGGTGGSTDDVSLRCRTSMVNLDVFRATQSVVSVLLSTNSSSSTTGALVVAGGIGLGGNLFSNGTGSFNTSVTVPKIIYTTSVFETFGSGTPEGAVTANIGSVFHRTDGSSGTTLYVKESGTGNTGWVAVSGGGGGSVGGSTGSTDNAILRADGTGGATLQSSLATLDDSGNATFVSLIIGASGPTITNSSGTMTLAASGSNQDIIVLGSGTGRLKIGDSSNHVYTEFLSGAGQQGLFTFRDNGNAKWQFGKQTDNTLVFYDNVASQYSLKINTGGPMEIMASGGRVLIGTSSDDGSTLLQVNGAIKTSAPSGGTAAAWKFGSTVTASVTPDLTRYVELDIGGTLVKVALVT